MKFRLLAALVLAAAPARADTALDQAIRLYERRHFPEAQAAFEHLLAAGPKTAAACYYLGMTLQHDDSTAGLEDSVPWLEQAVTLDPGNSLYQGDYGGTCLELADRRHSLSYANRGRKAMERAIALDPNNLDAREGLMRYYAEAPWPLASESRAREQAEELSQRDPSHAAATFVKLGRSFERGDNRSAARQAYLRALQIAPGDPAATTALAKLPPPH